VESLISEPRLTSHKALGAEGRARIGIPDGFVRLSCGIEDAEDIIADLEQALGE
jgi:cystathionine beta-lyase/cystathionine gamma-synthase